MWEFLTELVKVLKEPALVAMILMIIGLFALLLKQESRITKTEEARMNERKEYYTCIDASMTENTLTTGKLVTVVPSLAQQQI